MRTYTTCFTCGRQLDVSPAMPPGAMTHPGCPPATDPGSVMQREYVRAVDRGADEDELRALEHQLDTWDGRPPMLEAAALQYAAWGWPVFPCAPGLKRPATEHGFKEASTDPDQIRDWWARWPRANIGSATGHAFDVIDVDPPDGIAWLRQHLHTGGPLPDIHGRTTTPRAVGHHLYVTPQGMRNKTGLAPGIDYRGLGGYVLVPPSRLTPAAYDHKPGTAPPQLARHPVYTWVIYPSPAIKPGGGTP